MADETPRSLEKTQALERQVADLRSELAKVRSGIWGVRPVLFLVLLITAAAGVFVYKSWQESRTGSEATSSAASSTATGDPELAKAVAEMRETRDALSTLRKELDELSGAEAAVDGDRLAAIEQNSSQAIKTANAVGKVIDELKQMVNSTSSRFSNYDARLDEAIDRMAASEVLLSDVSSAADIAGESASRASEAIVALTRRLSEAQKRIDELEKKIENAAKQPLRSSR